MIENTRYTTYTDQDFAWYTKLHTNSIVMWQGRKLENATWNTGWHENRND